MNIHVRKEKETAEKRIKSTFEMIEIPANQHSSTSEVATVRTLVVCRMSYVVLRDGENLLFQQPSTRIGSRRAEASEP